MRWTFDRERGKGAGAIESDAAETLTRLPQFPLARPDFPERTAPGEMVVTWVGHSSFLLQLDGVNILLDPIWGERASPVSFAGPKRHAPPGIAFDALPSIDVVILSHDHYDHLDLYTVRRLVREHPSANWVAPLRVGKWLARRGAAVAGELDWWQSVDLRGLTLTCVPAQHFSGRKINNRNATLWCGWVIRSSSSPTRAVLFAGDTGKHTEFEEITRRLGPFDAAFIPIGAYDPRWFMQPVHMAPDEAVAAYGEIMRANQGHPCTFIAMHWGTFKLTDEPLDEPPILTRAAWRASGLEPAQLWIARHGETRRLTG